MTDEDPGPATEPWSWASRRARVRYVIGFVITRAVEVLLVWVGLRLLLLDEFAPQEQLIELLAMFDGLALLYLVVGAVVVRREAVRADRERRQLASGAVSRGRVTRALVSAGTFAEERFAYLLTLVASLTGLGAAVSVVLNRSNAARAEEFDALGVTAVFVSWAFLNIGYARFYQRLYLRPPPRGGGFAFPDCPTPGRIEFTYLAFTIGTSFAMPDVEVTRTSLRWRVLVHSIIAFFYNAVVVAITVSAVLS